MKNMNPRERVLSALRGDRPDYVPASSVTQIGIVEAMERVNAFWPEAHSDPEQMVRLGVSLYKLVGLETARIPFCLTVQAEAMGCKIDMGKKDKQPSVVSPVSLPFEEIHVPEDFINKGRIPVVLKATKIIDEQYPDLPNIVGMEGPLTLLGHIIGVEQLMKMMILNRETLVKLLDVCTEANIEYAKALLDAGADVITVADPTASPELTPPQVFSSMVYPKLKKVAHTIANKGGTSVLHICGRTQKILNDMAETGFDGLSIEEKVDMAEAKEIVGKRARLVGNVSAATTLLSGSPQQVIEEAKKALQAGVDVLAPGCGLAPHTPLENVKALVEVALQYGKQ